MNEFLSGSAYGHWRARLAFLLLRAGKVATWLIGPLLVALACLALQLPGIPYVAAQGPPCQVIGNGWAEAALRMSFS
jgi:hypothetical protein